MKTTIILLVIQIIQIRISEGGGLWSREPGQLKKMTYNNKTVLKNIRHDCEYVRDGKFELFTKELKRNITRLEHLRHNHPDELYALVILTLSCDPFFLTPENIKNIRKVCETHWLQLEDFETCGLAVIQYRASYPELNVQQQPESLYSDFKLKSDATIPITLTVVHLLRRTEPFEITLEINFAVFSVCFNELRDKVVHFDITNILDERYDGESYMMFTKQGILDLPLPMLRIYKNKESEDNWESYINTETLIQVPSLLDFHTIHQIKGLSFISHSTLIDLHNRRISLSSIVKQFWLTGYVLHDIKDKKIAEAIETKLKKLGYDLGYEIVLCKTFYYLYDYENHFKELSLIHPLALDWLRKQDYYFLGYFPKQFLVISESPGKIYGSTFLYVSPKMFLDLYKFKKELSVTTEASNFEQQRAREAGYALYNRLEPSFYNEPTDIFEQGVRNPFLDTEESESDSLEKEEQEEEQKEEKDNAILILQTKDKKNQIITARSLQGSRKKFS